MKAVKSKLVTSGWQSFLRNKALSYSIVLIYTFIPDIRPEALKVSKVVDSFIEAKPEDRNKILHTLTKATTQTSKIVVDYCKLRQAYEEAKQLQQTFETKPNNIYDLLASEEKD